MKVLLVVPPFGPIEYPNLAVSLLKPAVERVGIQCDVLYCSIDYAKRVGYDAYLKVHYCDPQLLIPERIFSAACFGDRVPTWDQFWEDVVMEYHRPMWTRLKPPGEVEAHGYEFGNLAKLAASFLDEYSERPDFANYDLIGFSTSYGQNLAALGLAKRIKQKYPHVKCIFGGANCSGAMGRQILLTFPFIDYVSISDADHTFPAFLQKLGENRQEPVPGILSGDDARTEVIADLPPAVVRDLDYLPYPDFTDYFQSAQDLDGNPVTIALPMETSRGCWWGEKHHCTFCGLNRNGMLFRTKSPQRAVDELNYLVRQYGIHKIMMVDNILRADFVQTLVPALRDKGEHHEIFFELKANLSKKDLTALARARITHVQPGIESLSTNVLKLMRKGVDSISNLQVLKWAKELGIQVAWNILCGFPGESQSDYDEMGRVFEKIYHLSPALGFSQITIDRFSPLFMEPDTFGIQVSPNIAYRYVYDLPPDVIENLAYWFSHRGRGLDTSRTLAVPEYTRRAYDAYLIWRRVHSKVDFSYDVVGPNHIVTHDTRPGALKSQRRLDPLASRILLALDERHSLSGLLQTLATAGCAEGIREPDVLEVLEQLLDWNYVYTEQGHFVGLATRRCREMELDVRDESKQYRDTGPDLLLQTLRSDKSVLALQI